MKIKLVFLLLFFVIACIASSENLYAVPFSSLDATFSDKCIGCKYYSTIFDAMSQGGYRVYTGLFNVCMFFLVVVFAFQMMKKIFKIVVSDMTQMQPKLISSLDDFWKDTFKMILKSLFVIAMVFTTNPQSITRWTIDPIVSGGIAVSRTFINYGIDQMQNSFGTTEATFNNQLMPQDLVPRIKLGVVEIPLFDINTPMTRSEYCANGAKMNIDADAIEKADAANNLPHALPVLTKLELMCLIQDVSVLSARYAGLATYYSLYTINADKIDYLPKTDKNAYKWSFAYPKQVQIEQSEADFANTFSGSGKFISVVITIIFIAVLVNVGFGIYGLISWLQLGTLITLVITIGVPVFLLILYFLLGGPALIMTLIYFIIYILLRIIMPFYFIQPIFHIAIILFATPLIATAWAVEQKGYLNKAIGTLVSSAIGMAVLCLLFVICVFLNEITFYSLYRNWLTMSSIYNVSSSGTAYNMTTGLYNLLIMVMMNLFILYLMSNYNKVVKDLFGGEVGDSLFKSAKGAFNVITKKISNVKKGVIGKKEETKK
ncbi:MAG: hypothetical protein LBU68_00770 [Rickettsiales bacterium]|jgi:hypothetical protein|nr:hypothetical protein [Rickettsiales bacterium]